MKSKHFTLFLLIILSVYSCKNENKKEEVNSEQSSEVVKNEFVVTLDITAKKDDNIHLYFTEDKTINFAEDKSVWAEIKGSNMSQKVTFKLKEDTLPTDLRIDFGHGINSDQKEIAINEVSFEYLGKSFKIKNSEIGNYFYPNKNNTILNMTTGSVSRMKSDQEMPPSLYPHTALEDELLKLTR